MDEIRLTRRAFLASAIAGAGSLAACAAEPGPESPEQASTPSTPDAPRVNLHEFDALKLDRSRWSYDEENDCYYQLGLPYCIHPTTGAIAQLAVYVPGAYFDAEKSGRYWECTPNEDGKVGAFTASTAPILMPVNSPDFSAQNPPSAYDPTGLKPFLDAGFVYVYAGMRGRSNGFDSLSDEFYEGGAPWALIDLKAAVRCLRYNAKLLPGSTDRICIFGFGCGGTYASLVGVSGGCPSFDPYLEEIGAATHDVEGEAISDEVFASASWNPVFPVEEADAAYEWLMGQTTGSPERTPEGGFEAPLSRFLAEAFGEHLDSLGLVDEGDHALTLDRTEGAVFAAGGYYDWLLDRVEESFERFVENAVFPLEVDLDDGIVEFPGSAPMEPAPEGPSEGDSSAPSSSIAQGSYATLDAYLSALNADWRWITYDSEAGRVRMADLGAFVAHCRRPVLAVPAYDPPERNMVTNQLFGVEEVDSLHFDATIARLLDEHGDYLSTLSGFDPAWPEEWVGDLTMRDSLDCSVAQRRNMLNPLYYLCGNYAGFGTARPARNWRIVTGVQQSQTTLTGEVDLALALAAYDGVERVDSELVWDAGFVAAERSGSATDALIRWIGSICEQ